MNMDPSTFYMINNMKHVFAEGVVDWSGIISRQLQEENILSSHTGSCLNPCAMSQQHHQPGNTKHLNSPARYSGDISSSDTSKVCCMKPVLNKKSIESPEYSFNWKEDKNESGKRNNICTYNYKLPSKVAKQELCTDGSSHFKQSFNRDNQYCRKSKYSNRQKKVSFSNIGSDVSLDDLHDVSNDSINCDLRYRSGTSDPYSDKQSFELFHNTKHTNEVCSFNSLPKSVDILKKSSCDTCKLINPISNSNGRFGVASTLNNTAGVSKRRHPAESTSSPVSSSSSSSSFSSPSPSSSSVPLVLSQQIRTSDEPDIKINRSSSTTKIGDPNTGNLTPAASSSDTCDLLGCKQSQHTNQRSEIGYLDRAEIEEIIERLVKAQNHFVEMPQGMEHKDFAKEQTKHMERMKSGCMPKINFDVSKDANITKTQKEKTRQTILKSAMRFFESKITEIVRFAKCIPGFTDLNIDDQASLVRESRTESEYIGGFKVMINRGCKVFSSPDGEHFTMEQLKTVFPGDFLEQQLENARRIQQLRMADDEKALLRAIAITFTDRSELQEPTNVQNIQNKLVTCLMHAVRQGTTPYGKRLGQLFNVLIMCREYTERDLKLVKNILLETPTFPTDHQLVNEFL